MKTLYLKSAFLLLIAGICIPSASVQQSFLPGSRSVMDAHNCYPYFEWWSDRIDRALSVGTPLAIEQDPYWYTDPQSGRSWSVVAHGAPVTGREPTLEHYFFDRIRPIIVEALHRGDRHNWPLITLNLDFKTEEPEHLAAVWALLEKYREWLTTAERTSDEHKLSDLEVKPLLVLTGDSDRQAQVFYDRVPLGGRLMAFGAVHTNTSDPMAAPNILESQAASNYRRWWNNPWSVVERGGQTQAGDWTPEDELRLHTLVEHAHANRLWIRFYTLDGATSEELSCHGWFRSYNFGSLAAARQRWQAAKKTRVDYIASDQYEELARELRMRK